MKRPMLCWVILFILGDMLDRILPISLVGLIGILMVMGIWFIPISFFKQNKKILLTGILFFLSGAVCSAYIQRKIEFCEMEEGKQVFFSGVVTEVEPSERGDYYIVRSRTVEGKNIHVYIRISLKEEENILLGSCLTGRGNVKSFARSSNPGGFDEQSYQYGKGIYLSLDNIQINEVSRPVVPLRDILHRIQNQLSNVYEEVFDVKNASLANAMVLGDKESLDVDIKQLYQRNGIAHVIAISGVKTLKLDIPLVPETRINWTFVPLHIAIIYILKLCLDEEIIPRCRFPCSRGYLTKYIN